jgi:ATP-dependent phosphofructokinase / diphosphate-dependent phosphofructokinase
MDMVRSKNAVKRIGILTAGSDCPGLNAAIRAVGKAAQGSQGAQIITFQDGFQGLVEDDICDIPLSGILTAGGTILGTSRESLQDSIGPDKTEAAVATYRRHELDVLVCIGGRETQESAYRLAQKGMNVITLPKGIDNDLVMTDTTIGFDTAMSTATEAIDRLHSTAHSHHRIIIVEIMGRNTGWLTLGSGIAGGADVIVIPEIPYDVRKIADAVLERNRSGRRFSIVAVSEGGISRDTVEFFEHSKHVNRLTREGQERVQVEEQLGKIESRLTGNTIYLANRLEKFTGLETRITILGHLLRGGAPTATDRVLATNLGTACLKFIDEKTFGVMVAIRGGDIMTTPLDQIIGKHKQIPLTHPWIQSARVVGTSLGD